jgi:hypothetical protein
MPPQGVVNVQTDGNVLSALTNGNSERIAAVFREMGAVSVDVHPVNLREVFLETVKTRHHDVA